MHLHLRRSLAALAVAAALVGCKRTPPPVPEGGAGAGGELSVEEPLQVVAIVPDAIAANQAVPGRVFGAGFQAGATVQIGDRSVGAVETVDENTLAITIPALPDGVYDVTVQNPDARSRTLRAGLRVGTGMSGADACRDLVVYFALDQAGLTEEARQLLNANASCFTASQARLRVEGHADERGTTDYNVALAMRRAESVRNHLVSQGVPSASMSTVSWGEERPADRGHDEAAWAKNRRVELHLEP